MSSDPATERRILVGLLEKMGLDYDASPPEHEPIREAWAVGAGADRDGRRRVARIADRFRLPSHGYDRTSSYRCGCAEPAWCAGPELRAELAKVDDCVKLHYKLIPGPIPGDEHRWETWIGQCPGCRTIYWRIGPEPETEDDRDA